MVRITAIMNAFGRPNQFMKQKNAILRQSIRPKEIMVWQNSHKSAAAFKPAWFGGTTRAQSNYNLGVWSRFAYALNARTEFICVFDDDTIPGRNWFQNCIDTLKTHDGLLGTAGVIFKTSQTYKPFDYVGWRRPNAETTQVDIVGHAWFFRREWLSMFWSELPPIDFPLIAGEDMHFSYTLQKLGISTYCPPHSADRSRWGSTHGATLGRQGPAISLSSKGWKGMNDCLKYYVSRGFRLQCQGQCR